MLENTFIHIPRIGRVTEQKLWEKNIHTWRAYLKAPSPPLKGALHRAAREELLLSEEKLAGGDLEHFCRRLPAGERWRLFGPFHREAAYLDIETTGLGYPGDHITTIALYHRGKVRWYVHGRNLSDFARDIRECRLLVTYNGQGFDLPFIQRDLGLTLTAPHIDLRYVLGSLGYRGGLKGCERQLGICRGDLEGVDGFMAVLLWRDYARRGNDRALETLLAYNIEDTVNLELLMYRAYNEKIGGTPFKEEFLGFQAEPVSLPFQADQDIIESLRRRFSPYTA